MNKVYPDENTDDQGYPACILRKLSKMNGVYVQCTLDGGVIGWLPLSELFRLFAEELSRERGKHEQTL